MQHQLVKLLHFQGAVTDCSSVTSFDIVPVILSVYKLQLLQNSIPFKRSVWKVRTALLCHIPLSGTVTCICDYSEVVNLIVTQKASQPLSWKHYRILSYIAHSIHTAPPRTWGDRLCIYLTVLSTFQNLFGVPWTTMMLSDIKIQYGRISSCLDSEAYNNSAFLLSVTLFYSTSFEHMDTTLHKLLKCTKSLSFIVSERIDYREMKWWTVLSCVI